MVVPNFFRDERTKKPRSISLALHAVSTQTTDGEVGQRVRVRSQSLLATLPGRARIVRVASARDSSLASELEARAWITGWTAWSFARGRSRRREHATRVAHAETESRARTTVFSRSKAALSGGRPARVPLYTKAGNKGQSDRVRSLRP